MLVLTRQTDESIQIGDNITITILGIKGNQIRIGINAPSDGEVHREEVYVRVMHDIHVAEKSSPGRTVLKKTPLPGK